MGLVLLAQIVDEEFQASVQAIYGIDKVSNKGQVSSFDDEKVDGGIVEYRRGPIKLMDRARAKAQNDYANEPYPASACVIDFNRCALIFDDISSLLCGLKLFVNKVKYYQSGNIIGIAREKNGFIEYLKKAQYADIKLNVVIKGKHNNIIGEVQFLLRAMKEYKDKAHNLYAIQRKEETVRTSVSPTLPILMDLQKEIVGIACSGNLKKMCSLMILQNQSIKEVMFVGPTKETVFVPICESGHFKMLKFLQSMMSQKEFVDYIFLSQLYDIKPIEIAVGNSNSFVVKYLFDMKAVQDRFKNDDALIFRLMIWLFTKKTSEHLMEYVLSALSIGKEKLNKMMAFKCPQQPQFGDSALGYHKFTIITRVIWAGTFENLQRLIHFIGSQVFVDNMLNVNGLGWDAMGYVLMKKNKNVIEYVLLIDGVKKIYVSKNNLLCTLVSRINRFIDDKETLQCIVDALGLTEAKLNELKSAYVNTNIDKLLPFTK